MSPLSSCYVVTMKDRTIEEVAGADAYQQEGQMTTFFRTEGLREVVDSWSTRLFSVKTAEILMIRRVEGTSEVSEMNKDSDHRRSHRSLATTVLESVG